MHFLTFCTVVTLLLSSGCQDDDLVVLPPATQEGKNTFGCLMNGEVWVPVGYNGFPNLDLSYDPGFRGGVFNLAAYRIDGEDRENFSIGSDSIQGPGKYYFSTSNRDWRSALYADTDCWYVDDTDFIEGHFSINYFDLDNQIISGTFAFTLAKPDCDTIRVKDGRFDMKI